MGDFWIDTPDSYAELGHESRKFYLHPWLRERISRIRPKLILDFGCGDGSLFISYESSYDELWLYDHSVRMIEIARRNFNNRLKTRLICQEHEINQEYFDLIVFSLVLMTIGSEEELTSVIDRMYTASIIGGTCLVAITHPCFRQYPFSTFETEFVNKPFDYMISGKPFRVKLSDVWHINSVEFTDFHWPLDFTLNLFIQRGFDLRSVTELPDISARVDLANPHFPCYLILEFRKR